MTLLHFKTNYPTVYGQYASSKYFLQKQQPLLKRISGFLFTNGLEIILTPDEDESYYFPTIKFTDHRPSKRFKEYTFKSIDEALGYGVDSALAYLEEGFYN